MKEDLVPNLFNKTQKELLEKMLDDRELFIESNAIKKDISDIGMPVSESTLKFIIEYGLFKSIGAYKYTLHPKKIELIKKIISK